MAEHKKQHWVPRSYLKAWADPGTPSEQEPYTWVFPKEGGEGRRRAPSNLFTETDMYTIQMPDGSRDLTLEHGLSQLESEFARIRDEAIRNKFDLDEEDRVHLCAFSAAAQIRSRAQRNHIKQQWAGVLEDLEAMQEALRDATSEQRRAMRTIGPSRKTPSMGIDDVRRLAQSPLQEVLGPTIAAQLPILARMNMTILCTEEDPGFITSDAPCVWFDPEWHTRPFLFQAPGLAYKTIEVTLPIAPTSLLILTWADLGDGQLYMKIHPSIVDDLNRRTRGHADEHFVVKSNTTRPIWFELGTPP